MTIKRRILDILVSAIMIFTSILMITTPEAGILIAALIFAIALVILGLRSLIYYLTMAKYMVNGKTHMFIGIIILDFGLFTMSIILQSSILIVIFLQVFFGISGAISIIRGREAKKSGSPLWKYNLINGIISIVIMALAFVCGNFYQSNTLLVYIFSTGLVYIAIMRIVSAFKKTAIVYIQ